MHRCHNCGAPTVRDRCVEGCDDGDVWHLLVLWGLLAVALTTLYMRGCSHRAMAQEPPPPVATPAATPDDADIAYGLMAESDSLPRDNAAELWIWFRAVGGFDRLAEQARAYCSIFRVRHKTDRMLEILAVPGPTAKPDRIAQWNRALESLRLFRAGQLPDPCHGRANHFGAPNGEDYARAIRAHYIRIGCGETAQAYWRSQ